MQCIVCARARTVYLCSNRDSGIVKLLFISSKFGEK